MRHVVIFLVRRAAQTHSRGGTLFWNLRLRRQQSELLAFRRREDAGRHPKVLCLFWTEEGRHAHAMIESRIL